MPKKKTEDPAIAEDALMMETTPQEMETGEITPLSGGDESSRPEPNTDSSGAPAEADINVLGPAAESAETPVSPPEQAPPAEEEKKPRRRAAAKKTAPAAAKQTEGQEEGRQEANASAGMTAPAKSARQNAEKKSFFDLDFRELDKDLSPQQREEWEAIYASYRSKSTLSGAIVGPEEIRYTVRDKETGEMVTRKIPSVAIIQYRVKVLIPETEMWMPGEERPEYVMRNMAQGAVIDYVILDVDRKNECAVASRRLALAVKRHYFSTVPGGHREGEMMKCRVLAVGPKKCLVEAGGYDLTLTQRDLSYTAIADLRERYEPGEELDCRLKEYNRRENRLVISVKEVNPNPFDGADRRHPVGSRRQAVISGKYGGGVFCTLPDDTVCLCLYSPQHQDSSFRIGDNVMVAIRQFDYRKKLIYGRILSRW